MDLLSSRVNDKICDCCDGSDEWGTDVTCPNNCEEMGRLALEEINRLRILHEEGYKKRLEYAIEGNKKVDESRTALAHKETELEALKSTVDSLAAAKEAAEEPERAAKDEHQQAWEKEKEAQAEVTRIADARFGFEELDTNSDGYVTLDEIRIRYELDDDGNGEVSNEEALEYLGSQQSVDFDTFYPSVWNMVADKCQFQRPTPPPTEEPATTPSQSENEEKDNGNDDFDYDDEEEDEEDDDENDDDHNEEGNEQMPEYDDSTKELIAAANAARDAHRQAETNKLNAEREIGDLKKYLEISYGVNNEFSPLYGQCYEFTDREYTYKMCAFDKVTQRPKNGGRETNLGTWGKWGGGEDNIFTVMRYEDGEKCWNGPNRSATVTLVCGLEDKLLSASEPNRCEYAMDFSTPSVCEPLKHPVHEEL